MRSRSATVLLALLVSLFLLQRCALLLSAYPHIAHPGFDETASGVLACDILDGALRAPLFAYQYESRSGDGLVEGFFLVPFFALLGRSLFSLKVFALFSASLALLCWIILIKRYHGIVAAVIFTACFAFPPPMFARLNLMGTIASHHLINPLLALQLLVLFRILEGGAPQKSPWMWLGFGLLAGWGAYLFYSYIIFDCFCILFLVMVNRRTVTIGRTLLFAGGGLIGFSPWILRSFFSGAGGSYLVSLLKESAVDLWHFVQTFCFMLPHSLGYAYPSRAMGIVAPLFVLFMIVMGGVIIARAAARYRSAAVRKSGAALPLPLLQGMFCIAFPIFFLSAISLTSLANGPLPFEYWPGIGFFGYFSTADVYRYRWFHLLFPFYFAIVAIGITLLRESSHKARPSLRGALAGLAFFLLWGAAGTLKLYSPDDGGTIFRHKGYSYDQMGNRFMLGDINRLSPEEAALFAADYPSGHRGSAYRCLGIAVALGARGDDYRGKGADRFLEEVPSPFLNDFISGLVLAQRKLGGEELQPLKDAVLRDYGDIFYEQWGRHVLGYRYYGLFLNREKILHEIPSLEKWFFKDYLAGLQEIIPGQDRDVALASLMDDVMQIPPPYRPAVMRGVGTLVGAEMLFDPLGADDYPLDSRIGQRIAQETLRDAFYAGVESGFAETRARFKRGTLVPRTT